MREPIISGRNDSDRLLARELEQRLTAADRLELQQSGARLGFEADRLVLTAAEGPQVSVTLRASSGRPPLLRAVLAGRQPHVADATAGLGGDAFDMAVAGCTVTAIERALVPWLLLQDGLRRALADPDTAVAAARISLRRGDAVEVLAVLGPFDVVYLDPLFPAGKASAGKRKGMLALQRLAARDAADDAALLAAARQAARLRVTVKRPQSGPHLAGEQPSGSLAGRTVRFDLYSGLAP